VSVVQLSPRCRVVGRFAVRGRVGSNVVRFDRRLQGRRLPAGTYQLQLRAPGVATRRVTVVISDAARPSAAAIAVARRRNVCSAEQAQVLGGIGSLAPGAAAESAPGAPGAATGPDGGSEPGTETESAPSPSQPVASRSVSEGEPDEGVGIEAFSPGRLAEDVPESLLGSLLLIVAVLLLALAALPRVVIPDPRLGRLLVGRRVEVAAIGASLFLGVLLVVGLA